MGSFFWAQLLQRLDQWLVLAILSVPFATLAGEGAFGWIYTLDLLTCSLPAVPK